MRNLMYSFLTALIAVACVSSSENCQSQSNAGWRELEAGTFFDDSTRMSGDTIGYVVGNFAGTGIDTLYCIAIGCGVFAAPEEVNELDVFQNLMDTYCFSSSNPELKDFYITNHPGLNYVKVDDLDNDGRDEMQFLQNSPSSTCLGYGAYDYFEGEWMMLTRPVTFYTWNRDDSEEVRVFKSNASADSILAYEDEFLPVEDPVEMVTVPKLLPIERTPIRHVYDTCYSWPDGTPIPLPITLSE